MDLGGSAADPRRIRGESAADPRRIRGGSAVDPRLDKIQVLNDNTLNREPSRSYQPNPSDELSACKLGMGWDGIRGLPPR